MYSTVTLYSPTARSGTITSIVGLSTPENVVLLTSVPLTLTTTVPLALEIGTVTVMVSLSR